MNTAKQAAIATDRRAIRASISSAEARLAVIAARIRSELQERYWFGYWSGSRAFLSSVRRSLAAGGS